MTAAPALFGLPVSDPQRGLTEALHLLAEKSCRSTSTSHSSMAGVART
jgi:hypothetical protein